MGVERYNTVLQPSRIEFIVSRSRFIGRCYPVGTEDEALNILEGIRKEHWDATHNCYAYVVGERGETARFSDDGEPSGTAGLPMMEVFRQRSLTFAIAIATRYFGGILLGAGGLVRAYSRAAAEAIGAAAPVTMALVSRYEMAIDYPLWGRIENYLRGAGYPVDELAFSQNVFAAALVPPAEAEAFVKAVADLSDGRIVPERAGEKFCRYRDIPV